MLTDRIIRMTAAFLLSVVGFGSTSAQTLFPDRCLGTWEGTLYIFSQGALPDSVPTEMSVALIIEDSTWEWKTSYLMPDSTVVKDYTLRLTDADQQHYVVDEGNGIVLKAYLLGDQLLSKFAVQGSWLTSCYQRAGDTLVFEITSGQRLDETEGVTNYEVISLQRAVLRRVE